MTATRGKTEIRLTTADHVLIYVNDRLAGEIAVGMFEGRDDLMAKVTRARVLANVPEIVRSAVERIRSIPNLADHINATPAAKQQAFARGLLDGLEQKTIPYPTGDSCIPPVRPEPTRAYDAGYDYGEALARCLEMVGAAKDEWRAADSETPDGVPPGACRGRE